MTAHSVSRHTAVVLALLVVAIQAHLYELGQQVNIQVNTVRPFNNPAETYDFYKLPFCGPKKVVDEGTSVGDAIAGDRRKTSAYEIFFRTPIIWQRLCQYRLSQDDMKAFIDAIENDYVFELFVDGLGVFGFVGNKETQVEQFEDHIHDSTRYFLYTHLSFSIAFNPEEKNEGGHVIACNITTNRDQKVELKLGQEIIVDFSYSVKWIQSETTYEKRLADHQRLLIGDQSLEIHWLSIINSFVLVILLTTFLAIILMKVLKNDFARYMDAEAEELGSDIDDSGWKQVHGDVFRPPPYPMLLSSAVGTGSQLLTLCLGLLFLTCVGLYYPGNGSVLYSSGIVLYALTAGVAGYVSTNLYLKLGGEKWSTNAVVTALTFTGPFLVTFAVLNTMAIVYGSTSALPFQAIFLMILLWALVTFPLTIFGAVRAKNEAPTFHPPCKTNFVCRQIPLAPWYRTWPVQMFMAGFLPFSAIYIELHYLFSAIWGHRVYTLFGILTLAFVLLVAVTSFITIAWTYFQLAIEDYRWWWRSFFSGGAAGGFIFAYAMFYFNYRSNMDGLLQSSFFLGYVMMLSYAFFLILGTVGFLSSKWFVLKIYKSIHGD